MSRYRIDVEAGGTMSLTFADPGAYGSEAGIRRVASLVRAFMVLYARERLVITVTPLPDAKPAAPSAQPGADDDVPF